MMYMQFGNISDLHLGIGAATHPKVLIWVSMTDCETLLVHVELFGVL